MARKSGTSAQSKKTGIRPIYVVFGKDRRRAIDTLDELTDRVLGDADPQLALTVFDGDDVTLSQVLDDLRTLPFLSDYRVVVLKDAGKFVTDHRGELETYLESPSKTGVLLILVDSFPGTTRLAKLAKKVGEVFDCGPIKPNQLPAFLINYASEQHQLKLDSQAAGVLIELAGDDSGILTNEIDKLAVYLGGVNAKRSQISTEDVQAVVGQNRQHNVFSVIEAMTVGNRAEALDRLDQMLNQDRNAEFTAVGAFAWHFRRLYSARLLMDKGVGASGIIKQVGIWNQKDAFVRQVRQMKVKQVASALRKLMEIDFASKTGGGTVRAGLEKLILSF
ncbi:MAG: DNA polymerase III subunit delta [Phycisphaerae bacterium]|nr:DNA polymerase III subunit delta [Phycisphaerae bacterium]